MGNGSWDTGNYRAAAATRTQKGLADFSYSADAAAGKVDKVHVDVDPAKKAGPTSPFAGQPIRESRDNVDHPVSHPIIIAFDGTGSMGGVPMILQKKLADMFDTIMERDAIPDPQICMAVIGDATCDRYPFQVGQFESDNRIDKQLRSMILEGGGGGQVKESYGLVHFFAAKLTATDAWEKRGKKGLCITMGDEATWPTVTAQQVKDIFDMPCEKDYSVADLIAEASERWDIFHICLTNGTSHGRNKTVHASWKNLLGERLVFLDDNAAVCEFITGLLIMMEESKSVDEVIQTLGLTGDSGTAVKNALVPLSGKIGTDIVQGDMSNNDVPDTVTSL